MSQKIKVQDGHIVYEAADPTKSVEFTVDGKLSATKTISAGFDPDANGILTSPSTANLILRSAKNLRVESGNGSITLNNTLWPNQQVHPGMFLGAERVNELKYYPFVLGLTINNWMLQAELNALYPAAQPGQYLISTECIYLCFAKNSWRRTTSTGDIIFSSTDPGTGTNGTIWIDPVTGSTHVYNLATYSWVEVTANKTHSIMFKCGDDTSPVSPGLQDCAIHMPYAFALSSVMVSLNNPPGESLIEVNVLDQYGNNIVPALPMGGGDTVYDYNPNGYASVTPFRTLNYMERISVNVAYTGQTGATGLKVYLVGQRTAPGG